MSSGLGNHTHAQGPPAIGAVDLQITDLKPRALEGVREHWGRSLDEPVRAGPHEIATIRSRA